MKHINWRTILLSTFITAFGITAWHQLAPHTNQANLKRELESKAQQIHDQLDKLEGQQKKTNDQKKEIEKLKKQLQAKKAEKAKLAAQNKSVVYAESNVQAPKAVSGSCSDWMKQAGIPTTAATTKLILNESGCRPDAVNPSSGACGIPQALPCSKMNCTLSDPVCQLRWMQSYVQSRYGTWENALAMWYSRSPHWY